jgi:hypothetical protein
MRVRITRTDPLLFVAIAAVAFLPLLGSFARFGGLPPEFGVFPPNASGAPKPGFCLAYFVAAALVAVGVLAFLLVPSLFGFRQRGTRRRASSRRSLPPWFWAGVVVNLFSWWLHWFSSSSAAPYAFLPLWWGFIVAVDGFVYFRIGRSLLATETHRFVIIALVSIPGWFLFEFLNYYAVEFWVYPVDTIFPPTGQTIWFLLSFSVVFPAVFEWFTLFHTFDGLWNRWSNGPKIAIPAAWLVGLTLAGYAAMVLFGRFPFELFFLLWVGPPLVLTAALAIAGRWTPFRPILEGNWSLVVVAGLASFANGIFWELWNYGSKFFHGGVPSTNPNYWFYDIPYVNVLHPFSEMPLLGYFGYLPFGFLAWVCWLVAANLLGVDPRFDLTPLEAPGPGRSPALSPVGPGEEPAVVISRYAPPPRSNPPAGE